MKAAGRTLGRGGKRAETVSLAGDGLRVEIGPLGAELASVRRADDPVEFLWQGDGRFWPRRAPLLFPIVGRLKGDTYVHDGHSYRMQQHGFARDRRFVVVEHDETSVRLGLREDAETLACYPFRFELWAHYAIRRDTLTASYTVANPGESVMPFSLGAHPGFRCPLVEGERFEDYVVEFGQAETAPRWLLEDGLLTGETEPLLNGERVLPLTPELFARGALVLKGLRSRTVRLLSSRSGRGVEVGFEGFSYFGIWSRPGAPFVCLEPWCGVADLAAGSGRLEEKEGIVRLAAGERVVLRVTLRLL